MCTDKYSLVAATIFCICVISAGYAYAGSGYSDYLDTKPLEPMRHIDTNSSSEEIKSEFNRREEICEKYVIANGVAMQCMYACGMLYRSGVLAGKSTREIAIKKCNETFSQIDINKAEKYRQELIIKSNSPKTVEAFSEDMRKLARELDDIGDKTKDVILKERAKRAVVQCGLDLATILNDNKTNNKWARLRIEEFWFRCKMEHDAVKQGNMSGYKSPSYKKSDNLFYMRPSIFIHFILKLR